jgi:hypothetical protein
MFVVELGTFRVYDITTGKVSAIVCQIKLFNIVQYTRRRILTATQSFTI